MSSFSYERSEQSRQNLVTKGRRQSHYRVGSSLSFLPRVSVYGTLIAALIVFPVRQSYAAVNNDDGTNE